MNDLSSLPWKVTVAGALVWLCLSLEASACLPAKSHAPANFAVGCQYDLHGNLTRLTYPDGRTASYRYDAEDRLGTMTDTYSRVYSFDWDAGGRLTGLHHQNGVNEVFTNDLADQVTALSVTRGATKIAVSRLVYDDIGRPIRQEIDAGLAPIPPTNTWLQHTHNLADRVVSSFGMQNGDRVTVGYAYNADGSLTNRAWVDTDVPAASFTNAFAYGPDGLATSCTLGTSTVAYVYSAAGVRVKETAAGTTRYFAVNPADPFKRVLAELDASGATLRSYIWAGNRLLCMLDSGGTPHYAHVDVQGSIVALTDAAGSVTDQFAYGPYGELYRRTGSTDLPFTWLGGAGVRALGSGLYATQHRLYDANIKRFIQSDPTGIAGGLNLYAYGNLNPLVYVDPLGLEAQSMGFSPASAYSIPGPASLSASALRRISGTSWSEDIHPMAMQCAIDTAFKALGTVALFAIPGPEDLAIGAMIGGASRLLGATRLMPRITRGAFATSAERRFAAVASPGLPTYSRYQNRWLASVPGLRQVTYSSPSWQFTPSSRSLSMLERVAMTRHETRHVADFAGLPQLTHLATGSVPGRGFARYALEYRGYSAEAGSKLINPLLPFLSFDLKSGVYFVGETAFTAWSAHSIHDMMVGQP